MSEVHERRRGCPADPEMLCAQADQAADAAVKKVFAILGVDIDKPESVEEFREDLRFGKKMRKAADHGFLALAAVIVIALGAATWSGIVTRVGGHG